ncbi:hypothetical protein PoB_001334000 [Plakobranchus ocellatus]|uniref:Uncharacterized protein n=1 Tax=Plakobranchus ocellatus TaxID=259542 RepID=A0AAV3YVF7_9GAST|nr:hypothetical protein PoB_001334000 [Plakobranchus ocellatus]
MEQPEREGKAKYSRISGIADAMKLVLETDSDSNSTQVESDPVTQADLGIANSALHLSVETNAPEEQNFLTPDHTQMDCDAMHSLVERKTKCDIFTPREDVLAMAMAREAPFPFTVTEVYYNKPKILPGDSFLSIPPGKKRGDLTVSEVYTYRYALNNDRTSEVSYKLNWRDEWIALPCQSFIRQNTVDCALC